MGVPGSLGSDPDNRKQDNPAGEKPDNIDEAGDRANVRQNTTHQLKNR
jgi:hypothetical protein